MIALLRRLLRKTRTAWRVARHDPTQLRQLLTSNCGRLRHLARRAGLADLRPLPAGPSLDGLGHRDRLVAMLEREARGLRARPAFRH